MPADLDLRTARRVAWTGLCVSALLAALNLGVGITTHSMSVLATGMEFAGDVLASSIVLLGIVVAVRPADKHHPYGHGRVETLAAFVVGLILAAAGVWIAWHSLQAVGDVHPQPSFAAVAVLVLAIVCRSVMSGVKFRVGRRLQSASLIADGWNDMVDILGASAALVAVALSMASPERFRTADHYGGFVVGILVVVMALRLVRDASLELMDTMPSDEMIARVRSVAAQVPGVHGVDKSFARKTGFTYHVDLHIEVDPAMTVAQSHEIAGQVRSRVRTEVGWVADVLVHVEPAAAAAAHRPSENR